MKTFAPGTRLLSEVACAAGDHEPTDACAYQVQWTINPHMRPGSVDYSRARAQHRVLVDVLRGLGERVEVLPFVCGAFDSVFIKDNAVLYEDRALLGAPVHGERRIEQHARACELTRRGYSVEQARHALEGGDVVMLPGGGALLGVGPRSSAAAARSLAEFLDGDVYVLPLRDPRLYHLDTALTVLADGSAILCREAFDATALARLSALCARGVLRALYAVPYREACAFSLNVIEVGSAIVTGTADAPATHAVLRSLRRRVIEVPLDQFHRAGGSAACLVAHRCRTMPTTAIRSAAA
jgi:N-dimethylarginine dimethylaminohydrolase